MQIIGFRASLSVGSVRCMQHTWPLPQHPSLLTLPLSPHLPFLPGHSFFPFLLPPLPFPPRCPASADAVQGAPALVSFRWGHQHGRKRRGKPAEREEGEREKMGNWTNAQTVPQRWWQPGNGVEGMGKQRQHPSWVATWCHCTRCSAQRSGLIGLLPR